MYENKIMTEPKWKSWIVQTTTPLFTPEQCRQIIASGRAQPPQTAKVGMNKPGGGSDTKKRVTTISWIPFKEMGHMYQDLHTFIQKTNENHFGLEIYKLQNRLNLQNILREDSMIGIWIVM